MFGTSLGFGGPYLGLFACSSAHVRRLPGRLVGETVDVEGRTAYVTTLRAREQDIRREKATSNVCTNQTLMAVTAAIQLGWLGHLGPGRGGHPVRPGHPLHPGRGAGRRRCRRRGPTPRSCASSPSGCRYRPTPSSSGWPTPGSWPGSPLEGAVDGGRRRPAHRRHRAADRRADRRLCRRPGQGGGVMASETTTHGVDPAGAPGGKAARPPCSGATPSPPCSSCPTRAAGPGPSGPPGSPRSPSTTWSRPTTGARRRSTWPRCPSATWSPTSPASPTASSPSTSAPTRWARAP